MTELEQMAAEYRDMLGLSNWRIFVTEVENPCNEPTSAGTCVLETRYLRAHIEIRKTLEGRRRREVLLHELFHVALAHINDTVERIAALLPETLQTPALEWYGIAEDQTIERMVRSMTVDLPHDIEEVPDGTITDPDRDGITR